MSDDFNSIIKRTDETLSMDLAGALRYFCFYNLSEFYRRYGDELEMSRATFFRVVQGDYSSGDKVDRVTALCEKLGLMDTSGAGSSFLVKQNMITDLVKYAKSICDNPSIYNLTNLKKFIDEKGHRILA